MKNPTVDIVILNYNGKELLQKFMPSIVAAARASRYRCAVSVLDNCSVDGSEEWMRENYPTAVRWHAAKQNQVLCSYNDYAAQSEDDILILLNNDMGLDPGFVDPLIEPFLNDDTVFFVATEGDLAAPRFHWGVLEADIQNQRNPERLRRPGYTLTAGVAAFDRRKFIELGGYDPLYLPGRYEDVDLCYRGWKRGWKGRYAPQSRKEHIGGASFEKAFSARKTEALVFRNGILFMAKNITDPIWLAICLFWLPIRLVAALLRGRWRYFEQLAVVMNRFPMALAGRKKALRNAQWSDRRIVGFLKEENL